MRFQFNVKVKPGYSEISNMAIVFEAPTWAKASETAMIMLRQLGIKPEECNTEIVYAAKEEGVIRASNLHAVEGAL